MSLYNLDRKVYMFPMRQVYALTLFIFKDRHILKRLVDTFNQIEKKANEDWKHLHATLRFD